MNLTTTKLFGDLWLLHRRTAKRLTFVKVRDGIAGYRQCLGLTQVKMAGALGISPSYYAMIERSDVPCPTEILALAQTLTRSDKM